MKTIIILLSVVLGYVSHPYVTKLLIKLKNKIDDLIYKIAERIVNKNKSITKPISTKNKYSTKGNIVKIYNVEFTDRQRHQSDNIIYQLGKKSDIIRISINDNITSKMFNDKIYYFTSWYYAAKLFKISAVTLQTKYANDIKLYTIDNYEVKIDIVLKEDIDNKVINSYKPVGRTNNKVLVKVKNTVSIDERKKKRS